MGLPARETPAVRVAAVSGDALGEGVLWDADAAVLWWLDIGPRGRIHRLHPASGRHDIWQPYAFATAMALRRDGTPVVATLAGIGLFAPETGVLDLVAEVEPPDNGNRPNDGACDPAGRFWLGTMQQNIGADGGDLPVTRSSGALWRIGVDRSVTRMADGIGIVNSPLWSPDGQTFYMADSLAGTIHAYDYEGISGAISNPRLLSAEAGLGAPDGSAMDEEGCLWNARWDAGAIARIRPDGRIDRILELPASRPTCCIFGGPDRRTLYITTASAGLTPAQRAAQPWAGGLLAVEMDVAGLLRHRYAG